MRNDILLEDTTLRDGEQTPGLAWDAKAKMKILDALLDAGVKWIEIGIPVMGGEELRFIREAQDRQCDATLFTWHRGIRADVEASLKMGFRAVHIGLPTSAVHLHSSVGKDRTWLVETACELVKLAKDAGAYVSISAEDVGRTEHGFLQEYAGRVHEAGANRIRLSDTIGIMSPRQYGDVVSAVRATCDIDIQCHTHNDYGLALANTLAGLEAGARFFHVTVNGIGERAGMTDLAQASLCLQDFYGVDTGVDLTKLTSLSRLVWSCAGIEPAPWNPVVGQNVFAHESGIHVNGVLRDPQTFEPFSPQRVGGTRSITLGKHSGTKALDAQLRSRGVQPSVKELELCLKQVRELAMRKNAAVSTDELLELYRFMQAR